MQGRHGRLPQEGRYANSFHGKTVSQSGEGSSAAEPGLLFWRSLIQWLGGLGILTLFLAITFKSNNAYFQLFSAEAHKIDSARPTPNIYRTAAILWLMYGGFTILEMIILKILGLSLFDSICHGLTTLSTGGFSTYDASIDYFRQAGYRHYRAIEYTFAIFMLIGGINFLIHFKMFTGRFREVFRDIEYRWFWFIVVGVMAIFFLNRAVNLSEPVLKEFEPNFRTSLFTVSSIITTTGYGTTDINAIHVQATNGLLKWGQHRGRAMRWV